MDKKSHNTDLNIGLQKEVTKIIECEFNMNPIFYIKLDCTGKQPKFDKVPAAFIIKLECTTSTNSTVGVQHLLLLGLNPNCWDFHAGFCLS